MPNSVRNTVWFSNFPNGRFANAAYQFWFATYLQQVRNYRVIIGHPDKLATDLPWAMFDLPDHTQDIAQLSDRHAHAPLQLSLDRSEPPESDLLKIDRHFRAHPDSVLCVDGFFQYDTGAIALDATYLQVFQENLSPSERGNTRFQKLIAQHQRQMLQAFGENFLTCIHVRRGDYLAYNNDLFFTLELDQVVEQLQALFTRDHLLDPVIYVATDDPEYCKHYFSTKGLAIVTSQDLLGPDSLDDTSCLTHDLAALATAQLMVASNSSFSMLGALMNQRARIFWRQSPQGQLVSFDPWSTPILYGMYKT